METSISTTNSEEPQITEETANPNPNPEEVSEEAASNVGHKKRRKRKRMSGRGSGRSKRMAKKKHPCTEVYLTNYEHELLEWACNGFLPCGAEGFWPSEADQEELEQEVGPVPVGPGGRAIRDMTGEPPAKRAKTTAMIVKPLIRG